MHTRAIRITRAGSLGRAEFEAFGSKVTILVTAPRSIASAALAARRGLTILDVNGGASRARAADRLAAGAAKVAGCGVLLSLGGDIATAGPAPAKGWRIRITDGRPGEDDAMTISLGGLATVRSTGRSAWRTVTVAAGSCRQARSVALSAASGGEAAVPLVNSLGLAARLARADGSVVHAGLWPAEPAAA